MFQQFLSWLWKKIVGRVTRPWVQQGRDAERSAARAARKKEAADAQNVLRQSRARLDADPSRLREHDPFERK